MRFNIGDTVFIPEIPAVIPEKSPLWLEEMDDMVLTPLPVVSPSGKTAPGWLMVVWKERWWSLHPDWYQRFCR